MSAPGEETADAAASWNAEPAGTPRRARAVAGAQRSADGSGGGPVRPDAALPEALTKFGPLSKSPVKVEPKEITTHREEWLNTWTEAVGK